MDVGSSDKWAKAPPCTWSAIPPPELIGEAFEDLSTNGGFVSFGKLQFSRNSTQKLFVEFVSEAYSSDTITQQNSWT